jgi:hypothetical protein
MQSHIKRTKDEITSVKKGVIPFISSKCAPPDLVKVPQYPKAIPGRQNKKGNRYFLSIRLFFQSPSGSPSFYFSGNR